MSKVTICDWCKKPFNDDQLRPVVFPAPALKFYINSENSKKANDKKGSDEQFDLCKECDGLVISRLRSNKVQLPIEAPREVVDVDEFYKDEEEGIEDTSGIAERKANRRQKQDTWPEDRDGKIEAIERGEIPHKNEVGGEEPPPQQNRIKASSGSPATRRPEHAGNKKKCSHMNKGRIQGIKTGGPWRQCADCGAKIPVLRPDERSFQQPPAGCNLRSSNDRK